MAEERLIVYRCAWIEGGQDQCKDFLSQDAAERHAVWVARKSTDKRAVVGHVYAIAIWPDDARPIELGESA